MKKLLLLLLATTLCNVEIAHSAGGSLIDAARSGNVELCRQLLDDGADPNVQDRWGNTPLHRAALRGHVELCRLLLEKYGVDPNKKDNDGYTPLHKALYGAFIHEARCIEVAKLIVDDNEFEFEVLVQGHLTPWDIAESLGLPEDLLNKLEPIPMKHP